MKHLGRSIASIAVAAATIGIVWFTKDGCTAAAMFIIALLIIWDSAK